MALKKNEGDPGFVPQGREVKQRSLAVIDRDLARATARRRDELDPYDRNKFCPQDVDRAVIDRLLDERLAVAR